MLALRREPCSVDIWFAKVVQNSSRFQIEANKPHVFCVGIGKVRVSYNLVYTIPTQKGPKRTLQISGKSSNFAGGKNNAEDLY